MHTAVVAAEVVAEVLLQEDVRAACAALSESWTGTLQALISAFSAYYSVQVRLYGFYWYNMMSYFCGAYLCIE